MKIGNLAGCVPDDHVDGLHSRGFKDGRAVGHKSIVLNLLMLVLDLPRSAKDHSLFPVFHGSHA
jgi:hypothetical protein